jgi:hypothetical protein
MATSITESKNKETHQRKGKARTARKYRPNAETFMAKIQKTHTAWCAKIEKDRKELENSLPLLAELNTKIANKLSATPRTLTAMIEFLEWMLAQLELAKKENELTRRSLQKQAKECTDILQTLRWYKRKSGTTNEESAETKNRQDRLELNDKAVETFGKWIGQPSKHSLNVTRKEWLTLVFGTKECVDLMKKTIGETTELLAEDVREVRSLVGTVYKMKIINTAWVRNDFRVKI